MNIPSQESGASKQAPFNENALRVFAEHNRGMPTVSPNVYLDELEGCLATYLDIRWVKHWVLPRLEKQGVFRPTILDVGAGKGRMTTQFAEFCKECVSVEPWPEFFDVLDEQCRALANCRAHHGTLRDFVSVFGAWQVDIVWISGVIPYLNDQEVGPFLREARSCMRPGGFLCIRELASANETDYLPNEINRSSAHLIAVARSAGLRCLGWRRSYPPFIFDWLHSHVPCAPTRFLRRFAFSQRFYRLWYRLAELSVPRGNRKRFHNYLFSQDS